MWYLNKCHNTTLRGLRATSNIKGYQKGTRANPKELRATTNKQELCHELEGYLRVLRGTHGVQGLSKGPSVTEGFEVYTKEPRDSPMVKEPPQGLKATLCASGLLHRFQDSKGQMNP